MNRTDSEFLDECSSVFFVFRQSVASFFLQLPTDEDGERSVRAAFVHNLAAERIQGDYSVSGPGVEATETAAICGCERTGSPILSRIGRECELGTGG